MSSSRRTVENITSERNERVMILVNSCISKVDRIEVRRSRGSCAAKPQERRRHAVSKNSNYENNDRKQQEMQRCGLPRVKAREGVENIVAKNLNMRHNVVRGWG